MKVVILAGGLGTRISEESHLRPKPMIEIGERPVLWHIMKIYSHYGYNDFIICLGHKGYYIKEYFAHYFLHESDITFDFRGTREKIIHHSHAQEDWRVTLVDTGIDTDTGGRIRRIQRYVEDQTFMLTYGDGVSDVNIQKLVAFHKKNKKLLTVTAIKPSGRYGILNMNQQDMVMGFEEKPKGDNHWASGGFFVAEPGVFDFLKDDSTRFELEPMETMAGRGEIMAFRHEGFWQPMDTLRDKHLLEELWQGGKAPWKSWE
jgi:glucose-1-phosphate cytidylyltransferase